uniref:Uncharacterized protein n=1 Tax=Rhizophora mucronata TaxID=61149 RepID=A0A2P2M3A4_RHIMU
MCETDCQKL